MTKTITRGVMFLDFWIIDSIELYAFPQSIGMYIYSIVY